MKRSLILSLLILSSCASRQGPDKTAAGAVLGAAWGAGAGAVVGHQLSYAGEGALVGAGFGAVSGALAGAGYDQVEDLQAQQERALQNLRVQNETNSAELYRLQAKLDYPPGGAHAGPSSFKVFFDGDTSSLRTGSIAELETIAESIKKNPYARRVVVGGHTDDNGSPEYNVRLSEARARTVTSYLAARGVATDVLNIQAHGASRPLASNATPEGRQLNRRADVTIFP